MTFLSHERALYSRITKIGVGVRIDIKSCPMPSGYTLLKAPISLPGCSGFGVAMVHHSSMSVPFWAQIAVLPAIYGSSRLSSHVVSRRSSEYEHREAQKGLAKGLLYDYLAPEFDLVLSRAGMDWHHWLSMLSMLTYKGMATYAPRWPDQQLALLDEEDLKEQNEDIGEILMMLEPGIVIVSWDAKLAGRTANLDESLIERLDIAWRELCR